MPSLSLSASLSAGGLSVVLIIGWCSNNDDVTCIFYWVLQNENWGVVLQARPMWNCPRANKSSHKHYFLITGQSHFKAPHYKADSDITLFWCGCHFVLANSKILKEIVSL